MKNKYSVKLLQLIVVVAIAATSCKKNSTPAPIVDAKPVTIGLYEQGSSNDNRIFIPIIKIGTQNVNYDPIFDTGSAGFTIDAHGVVDSTLLTTDGFNINPGDSIVSNGVTITSTAATMGYGNAQNSITEYGNLAYASITIPKTDMKGSAVITIKRVPIFLYYKIEQTVNYVTTTLKGTHLADIFGVGPGVSYANSAIASPLNYYSPGKDLTKGFKLALLNTGGFVSGGTYIDALLTLGLTSTDLNSSGFIMHPLSIIDQSGYSPDIPGTITYNGKTISALFLFDTGTPQLTIIEDKTANSTNVPLPANTVITIKTNQGFTYTYTTSSTNNLTEVLNPLNTQDYRSILSIDFFENNEFLTDYAGHRIGLKNN